MHKITFAQETLQSREFHSSLPAAAADLELSKERRFARMCYPVKCSTCSKTTWGGCGKHVPSVYANVPAGQACTCKEWPGVDLPKQANSSGTTEAAATTTTAEMGSATK